MSESDRHTEIEAKDPLSPRDLSWEVKYAAMRDHAAMLEFELGQTRQELKVKTIELVLLKQSVASADVESVDTSALKDVYEQRISELEEKAVLSNHQISSLQRQLSAALSESAVFVRDLRQTAYEKQLLVLENNAMREKMAAMPVIADSPGAGTESAPVTQLITKEDLDVRFVSLIRLPRLSFCMLFAFIFIFVSLFAHT